MEITRIDKPVVENKDFVRLITQGDYFKEMDCAIQNSPTASMAVLQFKKYCVLPNLLPQFVGAFEKIKHEKISYGFFTLWVEYDIELNVKNVFFRQSKNYRVKKSDDTGKASEYLNAVTGAIFPAFNKDKTVLRAQIEKAGGFENFKGQIYQYNTTTQPYELSPFVPVLGWMEVEKDTPTHVNSSADNALYGNNLFIMAKATESSNQIDERGNKIISNTDRTLNMMRQAKGVKNSGTNHVMTVDTEKKLDEIFLKVAMGNEIEIDKFNAVDDKAGQKICLAAYCFPQILAAPNDGLFGNSGEAYKAAEQIWASTCEFEAGKIEAAFAEIGVPLQSVDLAVENQDEEEEGIDQATLDAQAALRGSAEGVNTVLSIQASVKSQTTPYESGLAILKTMFGFNDADAAAILGERVTPQTPTE